LSRIETHAIALIESVKQIGSAPAVEHPDEGDTEPVRQGGKGQERKDCSDEVAIRRGSREGGWQVR
jgi:hypothetical protein